MNASDKVIEQVTGLGQTERTDLLNKLPQCLDADDQKHLATTSIDATKNETKVEVLTNGLKQLPTPQQQTIVASVQLPPPSDRIRDKIWLLVVKAFAILVVGSFLVLAASLFLCNALNIRSEQVQIILTVFMTASAFLTGLLAPSPISTKPTT